MICEALLSVDLLYIYLAGSIYSSLAVCIVVAVFVVVDVVINIVVVSCFMTGFEYVS